MSINHACLYLRPDHMMGMEGTMGPPGSQNNMGHSNSEGNMYSPSRYSSHQRSALLFYIYQLLLLFSLTDYWRIYWLLIGEQFVLSSAFQT